MIPLKIGPGQIEAQPEALPVKLSYVDNDTPVGTTGTTGTTTPTTTGVDEQAVRDLVSDWAEEGNSEAIPADKLTNAPGGTTTGLNQNAVDARVRHGVQDWAERNNNEAIPETKVRSAIADFARAENPSGHMPADRLGENPVAGTVPVVATGGRAFRYTEPSSLIPTPASGLNTMQVNALIETHSNIADAHHTPEESGTTGDDAFPWATEGNNDLVPTDKINFDPVQNQIDVIVEEIAHSRGTIIAVVGVLGSGMSSLRYTLPTNLDGEYDVSIRVKARVQVNEFANISGNLHIQEDGGNGLNAGIPMDTHNYGHAHEGVLHFIRKGLVIAPGVNTITFTTEVTGQSPPDVHFIDVVNMTITDTSLVNVG